MPTNPSQAAVMDWIRRVAHAYGVPPALIFARADIESNFQQFDSSGGPLTSSAGAVGVMQTIPRYVPDAWGLDVVHSWHDNVIAGVRELVGYYATYKDWHTAFAAYAAGPGNIPGGQSAADHEFEVARQTYDWKGWAGHPNPNATFDPQSQGPGGGGPGSGGEPPSYTYKNPMRGVKDLTPFRVDMGVDYGGSGPIYSIGNAKVIQLIRWGSGWEGGSYIAYRLTDGPAKGKVVYVSENVQINPNVHLGSVLTANSIIGQLQPDFPHMETGWATSDGLHSMAHDYYNEGDRTAAGQDFSGFLHILGAPAGVVGDRPLTGSMPQSWPDWMHALRDNGTGGGGNGPMNVPNGTTPSELTSILRGFGVNPFAFHDLIDKAIRGQWSGAQFTAALYASDEFHTMFPGIFRADGSLKMSPTEWNQIADIYHHEVRGTGIVLDRNRIGALIHADVSADEFHQRIRVLQLAKNSEAFRKDFNAARTAQGLDPVEKGAWWNVVAGAAPQNLYDEYEAAYLRSNGLHVTAQGANRIARGIDERGDIATGLSLADLVRKVRASQAFIGPELKANNITTADLALLEAGRDPRGLSTVLQQIMNNRQALAGSIPRAQTLGSSRTIALFPQQPVGA